MSTNSAQYQYDLSQLVKGLFNLEQQRKAFEQKYNVVIQSLDLTPGSIVEAVADNNEYDANGYHKVYGITRPDPYGFVRFKALDEAIARANVKGFPNYVSSLEALRVLGLADELNDMTRAVTANASYVQFLGGWTGALSKNRSTIFFASYTATDPVTKQTRLNSQRNDGCGFAATQVDASGNITWQGPTIADQEKALLDAFAKYVSGAKLHEIIFGWVDLDASSGDFI